MPLDHVHDGGAAIFQKVPAIRDVGGAGCTAASAIGIDSAPIARDHLDAGVCTQPSGEAVCVSVGQKVDNGAALQVHEDRAVTMASPPSPVINPKHPGCHHGCRGRLMPDEAEQGVATHGHAEPLGQPRAGLAAHGCAEMALYIAQPHRAPGVRSGDVGPALGEDLAGAGDVGTVQPSRLKCERDDASLPRQIGELAPVAAMHARRDLAAHRAGCGNGAGAADNNNSVGIRQNLLDHQVGRQEGQCIFRQGTTRTPNCSLYVRTRICQCEPTIKFADERTFNAD